ncbi:MAG: class I SAM-dependent methyltransferase [Pseudomonadales bacterium]|nr:class I SAM-dependent methyltransferase [Pseudomonadales bacterium]
MKQIQRSRTAEGAAAVRASHLQDDTPVVFADRFALPLSTLPWQKAVTNSVLNKIVFGTLMRPLTPIKGQVLARARFTEDRALAAIKGGMKQVVVIGAGLDSFCLSHPELKDSVTVYEIDHPGSQRFKQAQLAKAGIEIPPNLEFVAADLEREDLASALKKSSFDSSQPAFFYWLGVTVYLSKEAIFSTLNALVQVAAKSSELTFDYATSFDEIMRGQKYKIRLLQAYTQLSGEPLIDNNFTTEQFIKDVCELGYTLRENMSPEQQYEQYFADRNDGLESVAGCYFAHFDIT